MEPLSFKELIRVSLAKKTSTKISSSKKKSKFPKTLCLTEEFSAVLKTPEAPTGKQNIDIQTDQFVTELTDKAPMYEIACQTGFNIPTVKTPWAMP